LVVVTGDTAMTINVAIIGLGNVASALVQGVEYYKLPSSEPMGVLPDITEYSIKDICITAAFDVNKNKVGEDIAQAIFEQPNCAMKTYEPHTLSAPVLKGPILDGLDSDIRDHIPTDETPTADIQEELRQRNIDVVVILLPTGSNKAATYYATQALEAGCAVVNGMPAPLANSEELVHLAERKQMPLIGDDVKSQIGATIIHRNLTHLFPMRGALLDRTIQLDWGGDMDFCNLTSNSRYEKGKRQSKTEAVIKGLPNQVECQISAVDYIPFLENQKEAYTRIEGRIFGGAPVRIDITMQVQDAYNSAGVLVDMIRIAMIGKKRCIGGVLHSACSFFNKKPPLQLSDETAKRQLVEFIEGTRER